MLLRRSLPVASVLAAIACAPAVPYESPPPSIGYATFDSTNSIIPLPNDLALQQSTIDKYPASAQKDLLLSWKSAGGFPNDQKVSITIPFQVVKIDEATGNKTTEAPDLDVTSINPTTIVLIKSLGGAVTPAAYGAVSTADYVKTTTKGADGSTIAVGWLTLNNVKSASGAGPLPWDAGATYIVGVRGGPNGVKLAGGAQVNPSPTFYFLLQGKNMRDPNNQTLIPCDEALPAACSVQRAAAGEQLETLRGLYLTPFAAVSAAFPSKELAVLSTFKVAPTAAPHVETDPDRGLIPLPSDFMLDAAGKYVQNISAFGPLAPGLATLDGFSTTGMLLLQMSGNIVSQTVTKDTVFIYELNTSTSPPTATRVKQVTEGAGAVYVAQPPQISRAVGAGGTLSACQTNSALCVSTAIGMQPAVPVSAGTSVVNLPPFKENTTYAVLITNGVKEFDPSAPGGRGRPLSRSTLGNILLFPPEHPVFAGGQSLLSGVDAGKAAGLEAMRQGLHLAIGTATATVSGFTRDNVVMGYTFRTQSISGKGYAADQAAGVAEANRRPAGLLQFAAYAYNPAGSFAISQLATTTGLKKYTPAEAWARWGVDTAVVPNSDIEAIWDVTTNTVDGLSASSTAGAFDPAKLADPVGTGSIRPIKVLLAIPKAANVTAACPAGVPAGVKCAPLVIFHHGLTSSRGAMLNVANELVKGGVIVAAIDGAKHGDRSWCSTQGPAGQCGAGTCVKIPGSEFQGDTAAGGGPPGLCSAGPTKQPVNCASAACATAWGTWAATHAGDTDGHAVTSGQYFVSGNFFRTRDTIRQDLIDHSFLTLALARPPAAAGIPALADATKNEFGAALLALGGGTTPMIVNPATIHWVGQSLGAILGSLNLAANARLSKGVLNVGGGTLTDILTNAYNFKANTCALLVGAGIMEFTTTPVTDPTACQVIAGKEGDYLKFLILAKWALDPADPINAAGYIKSNPLPNLLSATPALQAPKSTIGQLALCDRTVPNALNAHLFTQAAVSQVTAFVNASGSGAACVSPGLDGGTAGGVPHGFLTSFGNSATYSPSMSFSSDPKVAGLAKAAQDQAIDFLLNGTLPPAQVVATP